MEEINSVRAKQKSVSFDNERKEKTFSPEDALDKKKWKEKRTDLKTGPFTPDEVEKLKHAMCRYCFVINRVFVLNNINFSQ